jgi:hypothetical protein
MHITSEPETRSVPYRYVDIIFPSKVVTYNLTPDDSMDATATDWD